MIKNQKIPNEDIKKIEKLREQGLTYAAIAEMYGVSRQCIQ